MTQTKENPSQELASTSKPESGSPSYGPSRILWIDNLRTLAILLVVNMHACVTYSHVGSWYYMSPIEPPLMEKLPFALWQGHLQSFFMGILFFVGGYFADRSLARKGAAAFLKERFVRLGLPTLFYMLIIHPFVVFILLTPPGTRPPIAWYFTDFIGRGRFLGSSGPMWFAFALLLFCLPFAALGRSDRLASDSARGLELKPLILFGLALGLGFGSFLVRLVQPIGSSILNFQFCFFVQYVVAFSLGVVVSRRNALQMIAVSSIARKAGWMALLLGPMALITITAISGSDMSKNPPPIFGGWNWEAFAMAMWEQSTGLGLALGSMALCARFFSSDSVKMRWLSDRSFGVYLLHTPILVGLALLFSSIHAPLILMISLLTITGWIASFAVADVAKRLKLV